MPVKILFVINNLGRGGAERMLVNLVTRLTPRFEPLVVSLLGRGAFSEDLERAGVRVEHLQLKGAWHFPHGCGQLLRIERDFAPDVVSTWLYHSDFVGGLAAALSGRPPVVWGVHNTSLSPDAARPATLALVRVNARLSWTLPRSIVCVSHAAELQHVRIGYDPDKFVVIPNGFDLGDFAPDPSARASVRAELSIPDGAPLIGLFARWHPQKNHAGFVQAARVLLQRMPGVHFLLAGIEIDQDNRELVALIEAAGIGASVRLLGARADIPRLTAALDLATSSSTWGEAFPMILGEAMACAVPCVATDVGDAALIVGDTGSIVEPGDPAALAAAWQRLLELPPAQRIAFGERARERIAANFSIEAVRDRYERVFLDAVQARRA